MTTKHTYTVPDCEYELSVYAAVVCASGDLDPLDENGEVIIWN